MSLEYMWDSEMHKNNKSCFEICKDIVSIAVPSLTLLFTIGFLYQINLNTYQFSLRPYVGVKSIDTTATEGRIEAAIRLENTGKVPANNVKINFLQDIPGIKSNPVVPEKSADTIIFPNTSMVTTASVTSSPEHIRDIFSGKLDWHIRMTISYDGIGTHGHETEYSLWFDSKIKKFKSDRGVAK